MQQLKVKFLSNYPSELLNADVMPSLRLLSLVHIEKAELEMGALAFEDVSLQS